MLRTIVKKTQGREYVFVDFFDTIMFRSIHSHQLMRQWEIALKNKYSRLEGVDLCKIRKDSIYELGGCECAVNYYELMSSIYKKVKERIGDVCLEEEFKNISYMIEYSMDMVTQYPNNKIIEALRYLKAKKGKKIYLVSDYYLPGKCYKSYLKPYILDDFFDGIFCSSDFKKTKSDGKLYKAVLASIGCSAEQTVMIGDSRVSDYKNAESIGIRGCRFFPFFHKILTNIRKRKGYSFQKGINRHLYHNTFKYTLFGEYALNLYYFTMRLELELESEKIRTVCFLSRGGYFLKKCFDMCQNLRERQNQIQTFYLRNSRKVNRLAIENTEDRKLLDLYLEDFATNRRLCVVDEGWYCSSQITFEKLGYHTQGYYIGIMGRNLCDQEIKRKGILFDVAENGKKSPLHGVFRTNCIFYEQLLSAPHGSIVKYYKENGVIKQHEVWRKIEKDNYYRNVERMQSIILDYITGLTVWEADISLYELANYVLKTQLFGTRKRLEVLKEMNDSWFDNANDTSEKKFLDIKNVKISICKLIFSPEEYLRYFCKIKDLKVDYFLMRLIYPILSLCIYLYCFISIFLKYRCVK